MATAWFVDAPSGYSRGVKLFAFKSDLTEVTETWANSRLVGTVSTKTSLPRRAACVDAYERRCAELAAQGWHAMRRARLAATSAQPSLAETEAAFDAVSDELGRALRAAAGDRAKEDAALTRAAARYGATRTAAGEPPSEFLVHFFAVDGVGAERARPPALGRVGASAPDVARWTATLEQMARGQAPTDHPTPHARGKPAAKKPAAKKPAAKKPAAKKPAAKKPAAKKPAAKKPAAKKPAAKKPAAKKPAAKKPAAKKPAAKKPARGSR